MGSWGLLRGHRATPGTDGKCAECAAAIRVMRSRCNRIHYMHVQPRVPVAKRLWSRVTKGDGCWEWQGQRNAQGYGVINVDRYPRLAHRVSFELAYGVPPADHDVCHACDNPPCIRPAHLWLGTRKQNMVDASLKGRLDNRNPQETCKRGHPLSGANLYEHSGRRHCRTCRHEYKVAYYRRHSVQEFSNEAAKRMQEALG